MLNRNFNNKVEFKLIQDLKEGDLIIVEVDRGKSTSAQLRKLTDNVICVLNNLNLKSKYIVVSKGDIEITKVMRNELLKELDEQ